jgi:ATP-binding cassette subfamily B protein
MEQQRNIKAVKLAVKHYWQQMLSDWKLTLPGAFILPAGGSILMTYVPPLIMARLLARLNNGNNIDLSQAIPYLVLLLITWTAGETIWRLSNHLLIKAEVRGMNSLYGRSMDYLLEKDMSFFHNNFAGSLTKKVIGYGRRYEDLLDTIAFRIASDYIPIIFAAIILWRFSPWLVVALIGFILASAAIIIPLIRVRQKIVADREAASNVMSGHIADIIGNVDAVKSFANEPLEKRNHYKYVTNYTNEAKRSWDYENLRIDIILSPLYIVTNIAGLILAITLSKHGIASLQTVFVTFSYFVTTTRVMWEFNQVYRGIESSITEGAQFTELLLEPPKVRDITEPSPLKVDSGTIELKDVYFRYGKNSHDHLFEGMNLKVNSGEKIGLVGHSGGGKTTITRLLLRFMDINGGEILIDGQNIAKVKQSELRKAIAYVPQEPVMFHRSLSDNIRYGRLDATDKDVVWAAKQANAYEFIKKLPEGYKTLIGERGVKLSGGQRQRIAIARAMIKNAPILVLDEATSALDSASEKLIQDALWKLMEGKTTIAIAHRLSTIQRMDRIIVLDEGKMVEQGSHKELLAKKGIYANLWAHQSGGFLED